MCSNQSRVNRTMVGLAQDSFQLSLWLVGQLIHSCRLPARFSGNSESPSNSHCALGLPLRGDTLQDVGQLVTDEVAGLVYPYLQWCTAVPINSQKFSDGSQVYFDLTKLSGWILTTIHSASGRFAYSYSQSGRALAAYT